MLLRHDHALWGGRRWRPFTRELRLSIARRLRSKCVANITIFNQIIALSSAWYRIEGLDALRILRKPYELPPDKVVELLNLERHKAPDRCEQVSMRLGVACMHAISLA
jgi:hypothetical protein